MNFRARLRETSALTGGMCLALMMSGAALAQTPPVPQDEEEAVVDEIVVTGSRIPVNEFTSSSPVQVLTAERAEQRGLADTAQLLQSSTIAAGSPQVNATISSAFVTDGGPGAETISLRGLGANRTLVLLNGRRAGPAGTRGAVSAFDLNVIPQSALNRVDILKDGASSIYGSDAVAGVVNLITETERDGGDISVFGTTPFEDGGGQQYNVSGTFARDLGRGRFSISGDYFQREALRAGDRDYLICKNSYTFVPGTRERGDRIDPRTGEPACNDLVWGQIYVYGGNGSGRAGRFQFDYDGDLGQYIPPRPTNPAIAAMYPTAPAGFFLVNYDVPSRAVVNASHPFAQNETIVPEVERATIFADGSFELGGGVEAYAEVLLNRRESRTESYRQFWNYVYTANFFDFYGYGNDPVNQFFGGNILSPTAITDHNKSEQIVDYGRVVAGLRGDISGGFLDGWRWDVFAQYSRSDGDYTSDVILQDAVDSTGEFFNSKTASCVGTNLPISGRPCIDVDFTRPGLLAGDLTPEERAFLFDVETGNTLYTQTYVEGFIGGELFELPAGPLGMAVGFHLREDEIDDQPGEITLAGNVWGASGAGITQGTEETSEVFAEFAVPLLADLPFAQALDLSISGRFTDTKTSGDATTYKVGLNWEINDAVRIRATRGTSFRAPALFELYLADQTSFANPRSVDPCLNLDQRLADGTISQELFNNCTNPAGPGGGVPGDFTGGVVTPEVFTGGGLGVLEPETSEATVIGVVLTPPDSGLSLAVDYFEIEISDEVTNLGAGGILAACYLSENFPDDPVCDQFDRDPVNNGIVEVRDSFINIANQQTRGLDFTVRYQTETPWGDLTLDSQTTWVLEDFTALFADLEVNPLGRVGNPELVGNINASFTRGPWTAFWGFEWTGNQDSFPDFLDGNGSPNILIDGRVVEVDLEAEFTGFHSASLGYEWDDWKLLGGISNLFDEKPPAATSLPTPSFNTTGNSVFTSQYTEGFYGRRGFIRLSKSF